jgi:hypothetical protein
MIFFIPRLWLISNPFACGEIEIKFKLDTEKAAKATVAIVASYRLGGISKGTEYPQLAITNAIALIAIIAILYHPCPAPKAKYVVSYKHGTQDVCTVNKVPKYHSMCKTVECVHAAVETQRIIFC